MDYPKRFTDAVNSLVEAFFDGELQAKDCNACAVGNICGGSQWKEAFCTLYDGHQARYFEHEDFPTNESEFEAQQMVESTGYSMREMARVEQTFESVSYDKYNGIEDQHERLMAVLDVLMDIEDIDEGEPVRQRFDHPDLATA